MSEAGRTSTCCVVECPNTSSNSEVDFHSFPSRLYQRNKWVQAIKNINGRSWLPNGHSVVCSRHFVKGRPSRDPRDADYVPSVLINKKKQLAAKSLAVSMRTFALEYMKHDALIKKPGAAGASNEERRRAYAALGSALGISASAARAWERRLRRHVEHAPASPWARALARRLRPRALSPGGVVAALCAAARARGSLCSTALYSDVRRALRLSGAINDLHAVWVSAQRVALAQAMAAARGGDAAAPPAATAAVADLLLLHTDVDTHRLVTDESLTSYEEAAALHTLWQLVQRHRLEDAALAPRERALRWSRAHADYLASGRAASLVVLQRRWHELKLQARERLAAHWRRPCAPPPPSPAPPPRPAPLHIAILKRYPHVATGAPDSWRRLVLDGRVVTEPLEEGAAAEPAPAPAQPSDVAAEQLYPNMSRVDEPEQGAQAMASTPPVCTDGAPPQRADSPDTDTDAHLVIDEWARAPPARAPSTIELLHRIDPSTVRTEIIFESDEDDSLPCTDGVKVKVETESQTNEEGSFISNRIQFADEEEGASRAGSDVTRDGDVTREQSGGGVADDAPRVDPKLLMDTYVPVFRINECRAWKKYVRNDTSVATTDTCIHTDTQQPEEDTSAADDGADTHYTRSLRANIKRELLEELPLLREDTPPSKRASPDWGEDDYIPLLALRGGSAVHRAARPAQAHVSEQSSSDDELPDADTASSCGSWSTRRVRLPDQQQLRAPVAQVAAVLPVAPTGAGAEEACPAGRWEQPVVDLPLTSNLRIADLSLPETRYVAAESVPDQLQAALDLPTEHQLQASLDLPAEHQLQAPLDLPAEHKLQASLDLPAEHQLQAPLDLPAEHQLQASLGLPAEHQLQASLGLPAEHQLQAPLDLPAEHQLQAALDYLATAAAATAVLERAHCCAARRQRVVNDARRRMRLAALPPHSHAGGACACCCAGAERGESEARARVDAQLRALHADIERMLRRASGQPSNPVQKHCRPPRPARAQPPPRSTARPANRPKKRRSRARAPPIAPDPAPAPASASANDYEEWQRQKNMNAQYFYIDSLNVSSKKKESSGAQSSARRPPAELAPQAASAPAPDEKPLSILEEYSRTLSARVQAPAPRGPTIVLALMLPAASVAISSPSTLYANETIDLTSDVPVGGGALPPDPSAASASGSGPRKRSSEAAQHEGLLSLCHRLRDGDVIEITDSDSEQSGDSRSSDSNNISMQINKSSNPAVYTNKGIGKVTRSAGDPATSTAERSERAAGAAPPASARQLVIIRKVKRCIPASSRDTSPIQVTSSRPVAAVQGEQRRTGSGRVAVAELGRAALEAALHRAAGATEGFCYRPGHAARRVRSLACGAMLLRVDAARAPLRLPARARPGPPGAPRVHEHVVLTDGGVACALPTYWTMVPYDSMARVVADDTPGVCAGDECPPPACPGAGGRECQMSHKFKVLSALSSVAAARRAARGGAALLLLHVRTSRVLVHSVHCAATGTRVLYRAGVRGAQQLLQELTSLLDDAGADEQLAGRVTSGRPEPDERARGQ